MDIDDFGILDFTGYSGRDRADLRYAIENGDLQMLVEWIQDNTTDDNIRVAIGRYFQHQEENG